jgi:hypothetical protein
VDGKGGSPELSNERGVDQFERRAKDDFVNIGASQDAGGSREKIFVARADGQADLDPDIVAQRL